MGNSNSGSFNTAHSPPPWTQSLPRDAHRHKKYGAKPSTKVLPERIPGQRLRPTENGRILQHQGTISHRKLMESISVPNAVVAPKISQQHSTSMSALNLSPSMAPRSYIQEQRRSEVVLPQRKTFKSEPDLREVSPFDVKYSHPSNPLHTIIHESPIKGRIMSKKRYKAPPPPEDYANEAPIQLVQMEKPSQLKKSRKVRIFKKNSTSKGVKSDCEDDQCRKICIEAERRSRNAFKKGSQGIEEARDRTRSLDNLQNSIQRNKEEISHPMHVISINTPERDLYTEFRERGEFQNRSRSALNSMPEYKEEKFRHNAYEHRSRDIGKPTYPEDAKKFTDHILQPEINNKDNYNKLVISSQDVQDFTESKINKERQTAKNKTIAYEEDPWDIAEREWVEKKKNSELLQTEIATAVKNLKKVSSMSRKVPNDDLTNASKITDITTEINTTEAKHIKAEPKTFFFGMDPKPNSTPVQNIDDTELQIIPVTIEKTAMNDKITKSFDRRNKNGNNKVEYVEGAKSDKAQIGKKIDEFVANIERNKLSLKPNQADLLQSISHEDGGYHSRQSSETWLADNEKDDNDKIKMNLRPTLPKRQLELPRFSPNAAWRSLGVETRSKENLADTMEHSGSAHQLEEKTHRSKHLASSRGSGEKSGDSGISGDGGSPGLVGDFEPVLLEKRDAYNGPIAISSPVSSTKLENKRAWTPAQDLDDNSFEDSGDQSSKLVPHEISTFPKLTSRTNMFADILEDEAITNNHENEEKKSKSLQKAKDETPLLNGKLRSTEKHNSDTNNLTETHERESHTGDDAVLNEDSWRENWSLSRSIPNSINKCGDNDCNSNSSYIHGTRSESRVSHVDNKNVILPAIPSYMHHGNAGHIMYLPQYKTYNIKYKPHIRDCHSVNENEPTRHYSPENSRSAVMMENPAGKMRNICQDKKKKFAYKSTIRMLEKRWLEEKLTKDANEKEDRRLKEMNEIMKVEREFRNKREKEKAKIKKQLQLMNSQRLDPFCVSHTESDRECQTDTETKVDMCRYDRLSNSSSTNFRDDQPSKGYQSASSDGFRTKEHVESPISFISGMKKWARGKKKHSTGGGYASDASTTTITSSSRQEPDGAPATVMVKSGEKFREVVIAGSRSRNGSVIIGESPHSSDFDGEVRYRHRELPSDLYSNTSACTSVSSDNKRSYAKNSVATKKSEQSGKRYIQKMSSKSPVASESSMSSCRRPYSPNQKGTLSPESKRSLASEPLPPAQELYVENRKSKKHNDYRMSPKRPTSQQSNKYYRHDNELIDNYRRNFAQGQMLNYPRDYHDECTRYTRHSSDGRTSSRSGESPRRNYSIDAIEAGPQRKNSLRQSLSYNYRALPPLNSSPARFVVNHLTPYTQAGEFRPVVFNSNNINKVLSV